MLLIQTTPVARSAAVPIVPRKMLNALCDYLRLTVVMFNRLFKTMQMDLGYRKKICYNLQLRLLPSPDSK